MAPSSSVRAWRLARPAMLPWVLALPALGWAWAHWDRALPLTAPLALAAVLLAWGLLQAGTLWLNALLDRDDGPVLLGAPVEPPPGLRVAARAALLASVAVAALAGWVPLAAALLSAGLAERYSHVRAPWKADPWLGPVVNVLGYGVLSPVAGWSVVGVAPNPRSLAFLGVVALAVLGSFFVAQAFQGVEDRARGYRTLVALRGAVATITAARWAFAGVALACGALALSGWWPRSTLLAMPGFVGVDARLRAWAREGEAATAAGAEAVGRALGWTALGLFLATGGVYVVDSLAGRPVAGLGTAAGHPVTDAVRAGP